MSAFHLMLPPFVACMVLLAIHSYLGLHILAREVIFVDLSLAQMAALGTVVALLLGVSADSRTAYFFGLGFAAVGAALFALTRTSGKGRVPQEAIIGIVYVVASATAILVASKAPQGAEALEKTLEGNILWVTWPTIERLAIAYAALGAFHFALRKRFLTISFEPQKAEQAGWRIRWWDFLFYLSFGVVITFSVPVGGVLMVFTFLVVPASIAFMFTRDIRKLAYIAWATGAVVSVAGNWISYKFDLPTGPLIVCLYGVMLAGAGVVKKLQGAPA